MDAEANKNTNDSTLTDKINIDEKNLQNESNLDHKDDDMKLIKNLSKIYNS